MSDTNCPLCQSPATEPVYEPDGTKRGSKINLCSVCGMLFSTYSVQPPYNHVPSISHKSDFGGIRIGKLSRAIPNLALIRQVLGDQKPARVLDVGASRGAFVKALLEWSPESEVAAIEPDLSVTDWWLDQPGDVILWQTRIEDASLENEKFNLIYASHTIEHIENPRLVLSRLREALALDGWLFVEVPDIGALMEDETICEQIFIDKHVTHFTLPTLRALLEATGFRVKYLNRDGENLSIIAYRVPRFIIEDFNADSRTVSDTRLFLAKYQSTRARNLAQLPALAQKWNKLAQEKRVVVWGVGRLFSALVEAGLEVELGGYIHALVDSNAQYLLGNKFGDRVIWTPDDLDENDRVEVIMACSRTGLSEIRQQAGELLPNVQVIGYNEI